MVSSEMLTERERIKRLFEEMVDELIEQRLKKIKRRSKHVVSISELKSLKECFFWYIDDPDYVRKDKESDEDNIDGLIGNVR